MGNLNPHVNVGYTFGGAGMEFGADDRWVGSFGDPELIERKPSEEFGYTVGADIAVTDRFTVAGDVIGRIVRDAASMNRYDSGATDPDRYVFLEVTPGTVHLLLGAAGAKISIGGAWLLTGTLLFPHCTWQPEARRRAASTSSSLTHRTTAGRLAIICATICCACSGNRT
jgi:hypothetical protein